MQHTASSADGLCRSMPSCMVMILVERRNERKPRLGKAPDYQDELILIRLLSYVNRREPSYQTTTSGGDSSLEQGHPWWAETSLYQATTYICEQPSPLDHCNQALVDTFEFLEHTRELRGNLENVF
jgi:hypothetical protein